MTLQEELLLDIDEIRTIPADEGLHQYSVTMRITTWTGDSSGIGLGRGTSSTEEFPITVANGAPPRVRRVSYRETIAAGGQYQTGDFRIGPLTPPYGAGGVSFAQMAPTGPDANSPNGFDARTHYHIVLKGPDLPAEGMLCSPVHEEADRNFSRYLVVHPEGVKAA